MQIFSGPLLMHQEEMMGVLTLHPHSNGRANSEKPAKVLLKAFEIREYSEFERSIKKYGGARYRTA